MDNEEMTAVDIAGTALAMELERLSSGQLAGGDARNDCIDNIVKLSKVICDDDRRASQLFIDQQRIDFEKDRLEKQTELEKNKVEAERKKNIWYNSLKITELVVSIGSLTASMIFTSVYFTKQAIYETTGNTRTAFGKSALRLAEPFQRKITRIVNDL